MNADVAAARQVLTQTLQAALALAKEHSTTIAALAVEEASAWHEVSEALLPSFDVGALRTAAAIVGEPRLPELVAARDAAATATDAKRRELADAVLSPDELAEMAERRTQVDRRIMELRMRLRELRAKPGLIALVEAAQRGQRLKEDQARAVGLHAEIHTAIAGVEAEAARLGAVTARHHRAKRDLANAQDEHNAVSDRFLGDARRLVADAVSRGHAGIDNPAVRAVSPRVTSVSARRSILTLLYEHWVKPHGTRLLTLEQRGADLSGFDTVTFPAQVELAVREASTALDAFRGVLTAARQLTAPLGDWWAALVPGVPRPTDETFTAIGLTPPAQSVATPAPPPSTADLAEDRLAAAWASMRGDPNMTSAENGALMVDMPAGETELLMALPKAPPLVQSAPHLSENTNAGVVLTSQEFAAIFDDVHADGLADQGAFREASGAFAPLPSPSAKPEGGPRARPVDVSEIVRASFTPGSRIGRCIIQGLVGKGGMGEVYRAKLEGDFGFAREVVLKRLSLGRDSDPAVMTSFVREAEIAARIAHPNVVQIFDLQTHANEPFMVMEYLEGLSLQKLATRAWRAGMHIEADIVVRFALDAARGLFAAHSMRADDGSLAGLVHRDVSPDNLFLCGNGFTKLLDFGIARRGDLTTMTGKNELKGKIPYMSPEQILGEPLDARSDLFSLGSTLYYLLSGERPFQGDNEVTTLYAVVNKAHRPLRERRPDAEALLDVVEQLLSKSRDDRPPSALDIVRRLEGCEPALPEDASSFLQEVEAL